MLRVRLTLEPESKSICATSIPTMSMTELGSTVLNTMTASVSSAVGATPPTQLAAVLQLPSAPPWFQVKVVGLVRVSSASTPSQSRRAGLFGVPDPTARFHALIQFAAAMTCLPWCGCQPESGSPGSAWGVGTICRDGSGQPITAYLVGGRLLLPGTNRRDSPSAVDAEVLDQLLGGGVEGVAAAHGGCPECGWGGIPSHHAPAKASALADQRQGIGRLLRTQPGYRRHHRHKSNAPMRLVSLPIAQTTAVLEHRDLQLDTLDRHSGLGPPELPRDDLISVGP